MKGYLVTYRPESEWNYLGFNGGSGEEIWPYLEEWNARSRQSPIKLENDICPMQYLHWVAPYYHFLRKAFPANKIHLIFIHDLLNDFKVANFEFIGYDCGYLLDEGNPILFSCIWNELFRKEVNALLLPYQQKMNAFGLFSEVADALEFEGVRNDAVTNGKQDFIETAFDDFRIVPVYLYNEDSIML